jgi:tetratricopeptide (TPR) repeat protein
MATFTFLTPASVPVVSVNCLGKCNKGPNTRILTAEGAFIEASMVRSVETVVGLLQTHLHLDVNVTSAEVLRLNYEGNVYLRGGEVDLAIECYDKALELGDREQEGVLLVMRGTALLQRAYACRMRSKDVTTLAEEILPSIEGIRNVLESFSPLSTTPRNLATLELLSRVKRIFDSLDKSPKWSESKAKWPEAREGLIVNTGEELISRATFSWSLYEHALLRALQDLLTATLLLPGFAQAWRRAGDALGELRQYHSAIEYYEVAVRLDTTLQDSLLPSIERLRVMERLVDNAESRGWPAEAILALIEE